MKTKKLKCALCNASYMSKFCLSLHQHVHQQNAGVASGFQCRVCKRRFIKLDRIKWHVQYHKYSGLIKLFLRTNKKYDGKLGMMDSIHALFTMIQ